MRSPGRPERHGAYLRQPAVHGDQISFVSEDDLWVADTTGPTASRLTSMSGEVAHPRFSPDGRWLAFTSNHEGPSEVYVIPVAGGPAHRLTFQAARRCQVTGWHPRTGEVLYTSTAEQPRGFGQALFAVHPASGMPRRLPYGPGTSVDVHADGTLVLGRNCADAARWKRYRGGTVGEVWIGDERPGSVFQRLPLPAGNVSCPCWVEKRVYFVSDHDGVGNVYSCLPDGSDLVRHTDHDDFYARALACDGRRLVYQAGARLYLLDPAEGSPARPLDLTPASSRSQWDRRPVPVAEYLDGARLSPDGSMLAVTARGCLLSAPLWHGAVRAHGSLDAVRYRAPEWLHDGEHVVVAAADERADPYLAVFATGDADTAAPALEIPLPGMGRPDRVWGSPTEDTFAFTTTRQELRIVRIGSRAPAGPDGESAPPPEAVPTLLDLSAHGPIEDVAWSPDGRWLAYSWPSGAHTSVIKVCDVRTGEARVVTEPVLRDWAPEFSACGRYLYFLGQREFTAARDRLALGVGFRRASRPYLITLRAQVPSPFTPLPSSPADFPAAPFDEDHVPGVEIDFDGIERRVAPFPLAEGVYQRVLGPRGHALLLRLEEQDADADAGGEPVGVLYSYDFRSHELTRVTVGWDEVGLSADRRTLLLQSEGALRVWKAEIDAEELPPEDRAEPGRASGWVDLDRMQVTVHPQGEWRQMFREAWQLQREHFWDPGMAGVDWGKTYERYAPLVDLVGTRSELSDLIWELQGELGTSHTYEFGGDYRAAGRRGLGFLGVDWHTGAEAAGPGVIARILPGDVWRPGAASPCEGIGLDVRSGDRVVAVNGQPVGARGPGELLVDQAEQDVEISVTRTGGPPRRFLVHALADEGDLRYRGWVDANRRQVHESTGGRVGYVHVPDMLETGYTEFLRGFLAEYDRQTLIVDVRFNPGGNLSWLVLERLSRRRHGYEYGRWSGALPYPAESVRGPVVALVNEHTGSDGDIFAHVFRRLRLGPLVGRRTWGGVIAAWPRFPLADGTLTSQPEYSFDFDGVGRSLENRGVAPDVEVDTAPHDHALGVDPQLARAVELALDGLVAELPHSPLPPQAEPAEPR